MLIFRDITESNLRYLKISVFLCSECNMNFVQTTWYFSLGIQENNVI